MIWQLAGIVGVDPGPLTLRQLVWMTDGRRQDQWAHTAASMSLLANVHRNPKKRGQPYTPAEFHPLMNRKSVKIEGVGVRVLKQVFVDQKPEGPK